MYIDGSVFPDMDEPPRVLERPGDRADYVHRVCAAWDYGVQPEAETFALFAEWKEIFDRFPVVASPAYHAMRTWFGWAPMPVPPGLLAPTPRYRRYDELEGRPADPCEQSV